MARDRELDVLLPMYGLKSSAQSHTQERVIQAEGGKALELNLKTKSSYDSLHPVLFFQSVLTVLPPKKGGNRRCLRAGELKRCIESCTED